MNPASLIPQARGTCRPACKAPTAPGGDFSSDDGDPVRGIAIGVVLSSALWAVVWLVWSFVWK